MKPWSKIAAATLLLAGTTAAGVALAEADADSAIQYRQAVMSAVGANMKGAAMIVQGKVEFPDNLVAHAEAIHKAAMMAPGAFKQNTADQGVEKTTVKGDLVWTKWDDFSAGLKKLQDESAKLAEVAATGDMAATGQQLGALGKACKACHDDFREK